MYNRILIDFDNVLAKKVGNKLGMFTGAKKAVKGFKANGKEIVIFSSRLFEDDGNQKSFISRFLKANGIPFDKITAEKMPADYYIDDKAVSFRGSWEDVSDQIGGKVSTGPKFNWGGRRPNQTGRPILYSDSEKLRLALIRKGKQYEKKFGQSVDDVLLMLIHSKTLEGVPCPVKEQTKISAIKIFKEFTTRKVTETNINVSDNRPMMHLPPMRPDPAKMLPPAEEKTGEA